VLAQDDSKLQKVRGIILAVIIGGITITLVRVLGPTIIGYVYNGLGTFQGNAAGLGIEAEGVAGWIMSMAAIAGILMIILAMVEAVASVGANEDGYQKVRTAVVHVVLGLIIIIGAGVIRTVFYIAHEPSPLLRYIAGKITLVLAFILFIAIAILIYAGFRMVISIGREEDFTNAKNLALRVLVGILVLTLSLSLVAIVTAVLGG
jgi:amino acid transporter